MANRNMDALARLIERAAETGDPSAAAKAISLRVGRGEFLLRARPMFEFEDGA